MVLINDSIFWKYNVKKSQWYIENIERRSADAVLFLYLNYVSHIKRKCRIQNVCLIRSYLVWAIRRFRRRLPDVLPLEPQTGAYSSVEMQSWNEMNQAQVYLTKLIYSDLEYIFILSRLLILTSTSASWAFRTSREKSAKRASRPLDAIRYNLFVPRGKARTSLFYPFPSDCKSLEIVTNLICHGFRARNCQLAVVVISWNNFR
jgi:hypothetical protein